MGDSRAPYEYEADSLEEKNKIFRLLNLITQSNRNKQGTFMGGLDLSSAAYDRRMIREGVLEKKGHSVSFMSWQT